MRTVMAVRTLSSLECCPWRKSERTLRAIVRLTLQLILLKENKHLLRIYFCDLYHPNFVYLGATSSPTRPILLILRWCHRRWGDVAHYHIELEGKRRVSYGFHQNGREGSLNRSIPLRSVRKRAAEVRRSSCAGHMTHEG